MNMDLDLNPAGFQLFDEFGLDFTNSDFNRICQPTFGPLTHQVRITDPVNSHVLPHHAAR